MDPDQTASVGAACADNLCKQFACTYSQRLLSSVDNLCKQFGPRSGLRASQDRVQRVLNSHGQENQLGIIIHSFNVREQVRIKNNYYQRCMNFQACYQNCTDRPDG